MDSARCPLGVHFRSVFGAHRREVVELAFHVVNLVLRHLQTTKQLAVLVVNLAQLLDEHFLQKLLAKHGDGHDRSWALARLGWVCGLGRYDAVLVLHALIIASRALLSTPWGHKSDYILTLF